MNHKYIAAFFSPLAIPSLFLCSCVAPLQQAPQPPQQGQAGQSPYNDPKNPYAVPGASSQGTYTPAAQAPYQPIPSPPVNTSPPAYSPVSTPSAPVSIPTAPPRTSGKVHTVSKGDTLWGLSRKYQISVNDIRQANDLSGDTIITGQTLNIPN